jgi:hypothetical protein
LRIGSFLDDPRSGLAHVSLNCIPISHSAWSYWSAEDLNCMLQTSQTPTAPGVCLLTIRTFRFVMPTVYAVLFDVQALWISNYATT